MTSRRPLARSHIDSVVISLAAMRGRHWMPVRAHASRSGPASAIAPTQSRARLNSAVVSRSTGRPARGCEAPRGSLTWNLFDSRLSIKERTRQRLARRRARRASVREDLREEILRARRAPVGIAEELVLRAILHDAAGVHEDDAVAHLAGKAHLVRDDHHRHAF